MKYFRTALLLLTLLPLVFSCQQERESREDLSTSEQAAVVAEGENFEKFYVRFHSDSELQMARIQFPLQGVSSRTSDHGDDFRWQREDWRVHQPFATESGFHSEFIPIGDDLVVEKIVNRQAGYGMERRFARLENNEWYLIYYAALHPL